jgi:hypothetical protein
MRILIYVRAVVEIHEPAPQRPSKHQDHRERQQEANAGNRAFAIQFSVHGVLKEHRNPEAL